MYWICSDLGKWVTGSFLPRRLCSGVMLLPVLDVYRLKERERERERGGATAAEDGWTLVVNKGGRKKNTVDGGFRV